MSSKRNSKGFTLIETLAALFIIMVGISSFAVLINQTVSYSKTSSYNLMAAYLGKEGIEIARNIRDSNFLKINNSIAVEWDSGLFTGVDCHTSGCEGDYTAQSLTPWTTGQYLKLNGSSSPRFFNYSTGQDTIFKRKITITKLNDGISDYLNVKVDVTWNEKGRPHDLPVQERIYPWWYP